MSLKQNFHPSFFTQRKNGNHLEIVYNYFDSYINIELIINCCLYWVNFEFKIKHMGLLQNYTFKISQDFENVIWATLIFFLKVMFLEFVCEL